MDGIVAEGTTAEEGLLQKGVHTGVQEDLVVFRWLENQISNKRAITACLRVLQGIACNEGPPAAIQGVRQQK